MVRASAARRDRARMGAAWRGRSPAQPRAQGGISSAPGARAEPATGLQQHRGEVKGAAAAAAPCRSIAKAPRRPRSPDRTAGLGAKRIIAAARRAAAREARTCAGGEVEAGCGEVAVVKGLRGVQQREKRDSAHSPRGGVHCQCVGSSSQQGWCCGVRAPRQTL